MVRIYTEDYFDIMEKTVRTVLKKIGNEEKDVDVDIGIVDAEEIKSMNAERRGLDRVTDVLSFQNLSDVKLPLRAEYYPFDVNHEDGSVLLGEIYICKSKAEEQAEEYGHSIEREIAFLTCHGMLHLLGYDHQTEGQEKEMFSLTEEVMSEMGLERDPASPERVLEEDIQEDTEEDEDTEENEEFKSGFVAIMGKPNAGKSTLINTIVGEKVAIVSWKPQTTRNKILGIYNGKNTQIVFIDTPGLHKPRNTLGEYMMKSAKTASEGVDCLLYVIDAEKGFDETDKKYITSFMQEGEKVIVVVNKTDHVTKEKVFSILTELNGLKGLEAVVPVSALRNRNIKPLLEEIEKRLTDHVKYYEEEQYTDRNMRFMAAEIIREKALRLLDKEVPYGIGVDVREYTVKEDVIVIQADIVCEKAAHKPIILGKNGAMIKKISTYARQDLENMTGEKVYLQLFVKVKDDWRGSQTIMRELGYDPKNPN